jgi:prophage tail gpP-like protein
MPAKPILDASNIHAVVTTRWNNGAYKPFSITSIQSYTIETNLDEDSDAFNIIIGDRTGEFAEMLQRDNEVRIQIFGIGEGITYLLTGIMDTVVYSDDGTYVCSGRDLSCVATDRLVEPVVYRKQRASDIIIKRARDLKCAPRIDLMPTNILGKIATDGSETEWEFWYRFIRRAAQWMWYEPDGTLRSGKLNYGADPTYFLGDPLKGSSASQWIPVERAEFHSSKQGRLAEATVYYHSGGRLLPIKVTDPNIETTWLRRPRKYFEQKDIVFRKAALHFINEEIFESQVGAQEIKLIVPDPGVLIRQNSIARLNIPNLSLAGDWFVVGTRIIADEAGFTQEIRLREQNFAISRRVPADPPTSQEPGTDVKRELSGTLEIPNNPEWSQFFIDAARKHHGNHEFEHFLAVLLGICEQETHFRNIRAYQSGFQFGMLPAPGVTHVEYFRWDKTSKGPQHGIKDFAEWQTSFANEPGAYGCSARYAVGPMQLYDKDWKETADSYENGKVDQLYGNRWNPQWNIMDAARGLLGKMTALGVNTSDNDAIWDAVAAYGGATWYMKEVQKRVGTGDGDGKWYDIVKTSFAEAAEQAKENKTAVEAVEGTVKELATTLLGYANMHPPKLEDEGGTQLAQLRLMKDGKRIQSPCDALGQIQINPQVLGMMKALCDAGFRIRMSALCSDHSCMVDGTTHFSRHSSGDAVDISALGTAETGMLLINTQGKAIEKLVVQAMRFLGTQKKGVYKPKQLICNGCGSYNKYIQSMQLQEYESFSGEIASNHTNHFHAGF